MNKIVLNILRSLEYLVAQLILQQLSNRVNGILIPKCTNFLCVKTPAKIKECRSSVDLSAPSIPCSSPKHTIYAFLICIVQIVYLSLELGCEKNENRQKEAGI